MTEDNLGKAVNRTQEGSWAAHQPCLFTTHPVFTAEVMKLLKLLDRAQSILQKREKIKISKSW